MITTTLLRRVAKMFPEGNDTRAALTLLARLSDEDDERAERAHERALEDTVGADKQWGSS